MAYGLFQTYHVYPGCNFEGGLGDQCRRYNLVGPNLVSYKKDRPQEKKTKNMVIKRVPLEPTSHHMVSRFYTGLKLCHFKRETPTGIHVLHVKNWYDML